MRAWTAMAGASLCASASLGFAQDNPAPAVPLPDDPPAAVAAADNAVRLDEVRVTAQRKVATVQETPISIEAFSAEKLSLRGISGLGDIASHVPSMTIEPFPTHNATLRIAIRGIVTNDAQVTQDPAVGVYLDGVYIARSVGLAIDTADLERIEVLRGPQGTLYGRNTTGGAINLVTRRPQPGLFSMQQQLNVGTRHQLMGKTMFNLPLTDTLAVKLALVGSKRDGWVENTGPGGDFGDRRETAVRFDARWLATDWLTVDYGYDRTDTTYYNYMFQSILLPETDHGQAELFKPSAVANTVYSPRRLDHLATALPMDPSGSHIQGHALNLMVPLGDYELKYIGAYRKLTDDEYTDLSGGNGSPEYRIDTQAYDGPSSTRANGGPTPAETPQVFQDQWSHEIQFSGKLFQGTLEFITGAFHFVENGGENGRPLHHILNTRLDPQQAQPLFSQVPGLDALFTGTVAPMVVAYWDYFFQIHNTAHAVFGQVTWSPDALERRFHLTFGLRKSWDRREAVKDFIQTEFVEGQAAGQPAMVFPVPAMQGNDDFINVRAARSFSDFSPSLNLQYEFTHAATGYLSVTRAYKSGGFNLRDPQISGASGPASDKVNYGFGFVDGFKPETVRSYELGLKSEWLGRRLRLNGDIFHSEYRDMQTNFLVSGTITDTKSRNAGKAQMHGLELDTTLAAAQGLVLGFDFAYLHTKVTEVIDIDGNNLANLYPFISAPPQSYVGSVDWTFLEGGWGNLRAYASYNWTGHRNGLVVTEPRRGKTATDGYGLFNARVVAGGLHPFGRGSLDVALWGKNLADKEYPLTAIDNLPQADRAVIWGEPRSFGLDLLYRWD